MTISFQLWAKNLVESAAALADEETQCRRWVAPDAASWERPAELLMVLLDDCCLELFIKENRAKLSQTQLGAAMDLAQAASAYDCGPDGWRDPHEVLRDPGWRSLRLKARAFAAAFESAWDLQ
jgi:hypothetical protein